MLSMKAVDLMKKVFRHWRVDNAEIMGLIGLLELRTTTEWAVKTIENLNEHSIYIQRCDGKKLPRKNGYISDSKTFASSLKFLRGSLYYILTNL